MEKLMQNRWIAGSFITLMILTILYLLYLLRPIIWGIFSFVKEITLPFLIALIISYLLHPVVNWFVQWGVKRPIAVILIYIIFFLGIGIIIYRAIPTFIVQYQELREHLPQILRMFDEWIKQLKYIQKYWPEGVRKGIEESIVRYENNLSSWISQMFDGVGGLMMGLTNYLLIPFIVYYMLKDYERFHQMMVRVFPKDKRKKILILMRDINEGLGSYISGQLLVASLVGLLAYIGYLIIDLPYPMVFGIISMIFNIIPYIGPFLGAGPAILIALTVSWKLALYAALVNIIVQTIEGNLLSPLIVGRTTHLHPLSIILAILIGGKLAGIPGLILAVPILVTLKVIVYQLVDHYVRD